MLLASSTWLWLTRPRGSRCGRRRRAGEDVEEYLTLSRQRDRRVRRVRRRTVVGVAAAVLGPVAALMAYVLVPGWLLVSVVPVAVLGLGRMGQPADDPVIHRAVEIPRFAFTAPITRDGRG